MNKVEKDLQIIEEYSVEIFDKLVTTCSKEYDDYINSQHMTLEVFMKNVLLHLLIECSTYKKAIDYTNTNVYYTNTVYGD